MWRHKYTQRLNGKEITVLADDVKEIYNVIRTSLVAFVNDNIEESQVSNLLEDSKKILEEFRINKEAK